MKHTISLKYNHVFRRLYQRGKSKASPYFAIYCKKNPWENSRLGITTGVKLGNAVKRNRARRRIRALYRENEVQIKAGYDIVIVARTRVIFARHSQLQQSFVDTMDKLGLIVREEER